MTVGAEPHELVLKLGPFAVTRVLGRGGMGIVYAGKHERTGVEVAIKTVGGGSAAFMSYVRHEASTLSRIRHPGVVQILGIGIEEGRPWYAMEILTGRTLSALLAIDGLARDHANGLSWTHTATSDYLSERLIAAQEVAAQQDLATRPLGAQGRAAAMRHALGTSPTAAAPSLESGKPGEPGEPAPLLARSSSPARPGQLACDLEKMLPIMRGVCNALAFVHGEGVVHRDLKPDNIFIRTGELPVLVDFGLATHVGAGGRDVLENVGGVAGSLGYMAPEQLRGELLDARCDLYALGCILYQLVTGRLPFEGSPSRVIAGHLMDPPAPPRQLVPGVPGALDELICELLVKDRDHRVGSAEAVDAVLGAIGGAPCHWLAPLPAPQPFLYRPPFVGRQGVLGRLVERLQRFAAASDEAQKDAQKDAQNDELAGGLVLITGESGAGKTRLALEAVKLGTESSALPITCTCAAGASPLSPLRELFRALVEHCLAGSGEHGGGMGSEREREREIERVLGAGAAVLALYSPEIAELPWVARLPEPEPLPSAAARARVFRSLTDALHQLADTRPLLLTLDDLHLADGFTLELLAHLQGELERGTAPRMLVLCTYRSEERSPALEALAAHPGALHLVVERMSEGEVGQMVRGMLALADPPPAFVAFLARESGGNPFFVAEYLRTAVAERVLVRDSRGRWQIADTRVPTQEMCEALPLPRSLRQVVELRLGKLAAGTRQVLDAAAVIGRRVSSRLLRAVVPLDDDALIEALDEMVAAQVLEPLDGEHYRFVHDKLHELPAAAQEPAQRGAMHARIADAMEELHADAIAEHEATIGRHWEEAGHPERAALRLGSAGDHARKVHSVDMAIELYRAARRQVDLVLGGEAGEDGEAKVASPAGDVATWRARARELDEKLGDALAFSSQHALARAAFQAAREHLGAGEPIIRARLCRKISKSWESMHDYAEALAGYAELEELIAAAGDLARELEPEWIHLMLGRAWIYYWSNRVDEMNVAIEQVRPVLEARGSALDRYRFYLALVTRDYRRDRFQISARTLEHGRECLAAAREANAPSEIAFARFVRGFGLLFAWRLDEAEAEIEAALQAARKISDAVVETRSIAYLALVHCLAGNLAEATATATAALAMSRARKMGDYEAMSLALLGRLAHTAGESERAAELCRQATAIWNAMMAYPFPFRWIAGLPMLEQGLARRAPARALADLARELTAQNQHHLPDSLDEALRAAIAGDERGAEAGTGTGDETEAFVAQSIRRAIELAHQLGYLRQSP